MAYNCKCGEVMFKTTTTAETEIEVLFWRLYICDECGIGRWIYEERD